MEEGGWFNSKDVFVKDADLQNRMLNVFGMYWHIIVKVNDNTDLGTLKIPNETLKENIF